MEFYAVAAESGWVGQLVADGMGTNGLLVGDKGLFNFDTYRAILSFDTSSVPKVQLRSATLQLRRKSEEGTINSLSLDIKEGAFGGSNTLQRTDYDAPASANSITNIAIPSSNGTTTTEIPPSSLRYITSGVNHRTQFRITSTTPSSFSKNQIVFNGGTEEDQANAPRLVVTW